MKCEEWEQVNYRARAKEKSSRYKDQEQKLEPKVKNSRETKGSSTEKTKNTFTRRLGSVLNVFYMVNLCAASIENESMV